MISRKEQYEKDKRAAESRYERATAPGKVTHQAIADAAYRNYLRALLAAKRKYER
jgi:hypothetical protein